MKYLKKFEDGGYDVNPEFITPELLEIVKKVIEEFGFKHNDIVKLEIEEKLSELTETLYYINENIIDDGIKLHFKLLDLEESSRLLYSLVVDDKAFKISRQRLTSLDSIMDRCDFNNKSHISSNNRLIEMIFDKEIDWLYIEEHLIKSKNSLIKFLKTIDIEYVEFDEFHILNFLKVDKVYTVWKNSISIHSIDYFVAGDAAASNEFGTDLMKRINKEIRKIGYIMSLSQSFDEADLRFYKL